MKVETFIVEAGQAASFTLITWPGCTGGLSLRLRCGW
jgi:hypothetical protein